MCFTCLTNPVGRVTTAAAAMVPLLCAAAGVRAPVAEDAKTVVGIAKPVSIDAVQADGWARFETLARRCAPGVAPQLLGRVASVESGGNPFAIGVVGGRLARQPKTLPEALATVSELDAGGWNYSMGLVQVNVHNLAKYGQTAASVFDPCINLRTGAAILRACYDHDAPDAARQDSVVRAALSCYYSGNFSGGMSYARKVAAAQPVTTVAAQDVGIPVIPDVHPGAAEGAATDGASASPRTAHRRSLARKANARVGDDWFMTWSDDDDGMPATAAGVSRSDLDQGREAK